MKSKFYCALNTLLHRARSASELVNVQLFKSFCVPVISYALEAVSPNKSSIYMLDSLINRAVFRIFKCSSMPEIWFIRSMFDLEAIGVMLERRKSNFISKFRCIVCYMLMLFFVAYRPSCV